ncbi:energy transducer TonB [Sulfurimonas sp.]|uniref:energy transducer TonB n=1 Tax=Sulfurimonas sp. TaxID=2022749 RepID=UPI0026275F8E|nr:energy transducer TonB [Sulfurimonas sp.]MDD3451414.1 TonB family protein [Sulfurimonas sp.]
MSLVLYFYGNETKPEQEILIKIPIKLSVIEASPQTKAQHQAKEEVCIVQPQEKKPQRVQESQKKERKTVQKKVEKKVEKKEEEKVEEKTLEEKVEKSQLKEEITPQPQKSVAPEIHKEIASEQKTVPPIETKPYHQEYYELNIQKIVELLQEYLYYPRSARQKEITGVVKVKCTLDTDAKVHDVIVVESSNEILSRAAIKTIEDLSTKFPKPKSQTTLTIPITYSLTSQ